MILTTIFKEVEINMQVVFDKLSSNEQRAFLSDNINHLEDDELIAELSDRGYDITKSN